MKQRMILMLFLALGSLGAVSQQREAAFTMNQRLGRGINMGNCFEAPSESAWSNPWRPEYFRIMAELGFQHVRIPIRWETADRGSASPPYTIAPSFLNRIRQVVDTALKYKLHAIINMHHHEALIADPEGQKARFLSQWNQIAQYFSTYPDSLLFEVLNEPNGNLTAAKWNTHFADALAEIRKTNPTRIVVMGVAEWGGLSAINALQFPDDENILLTIHYYNPFHFTHQGAEWSEGSSAWLGTTWNDTEFERQTVQTEFRNAIQLAQNQHIPIHIGEFGAYSKADEASRVRWTTFLSRWFEEQGFSWAYWEFSAGFGIYNPSTKKILTPLANALLVNPMPQPTPVEVFPVYISNFSTSNDGWSFYAQQGASGSMTRSGGKLIITLNAAGTQAWHAQLHRGSITLEKGKSYRLSFKAGATAPRTISVYTGKASDPWNAYSDYFSSSLSTTEEAFSFTFTMKSETDRAARIVFDLGNALPAVTIYDVKLEEIRITSSTIIPENRKNRIYPNPAGDQITIDHEGESALAEIISMSGKTFRTFWVEPGPNTVEIRRLPQGIYLLRISTRERSESHTLIRK